jgi:hypothetical protein
MSRWKITGKNKIGNISSDFDLDSDIFESKNKKPNQ